MQISCCVFIIVLYILVFLIRVSQKNKFETGELKQLKSNLSGKQIAEKMLEYYDFKREIIPEENEETEEETEEYIPEEKVNDRVYESFSGGSSTTRRFSFEKINENTSNTSETDKKEKISENIEDTSQIEIIKGKKECKVRIEKGVPTVLATEDILLGTDATSASFVTYVITAEYCRKHKSIKHSLIKFLSLIPSLIIQIAWTIPVLVISQVFYFSPYFIYISTGIIFLSFILDFLNIFYERKVASSSLDALFKTEIIEEDEAEDIKEVLNGIAIKDTSNCLSFFVWFLRKFLGYKI